MAVTDEVLVDAGATEALVKAYLGGDDHTNPEPVHDDATDLDATDFNRLVKAVSELVKRARPGNIVCVPYYLATTPGSATTACLMQGSASGTNMFYKNATVVGITARFATDITAGSAIIRPYFNGSPSTFALTMTVGETKARAYQLPGDRAAIAAGTANSDILDAASLDVFTFGVTTSSTTWSGSSTLYANLFLSVGEEEDI